MVFWHLKIPIPMCKLIHFHAIVYIVGGCLGKYRVFDINLIRRSLVEMHATLYELSYYENVMRFYTK